MTNTMLRTNDAPTPPRMRWTRRENRYGNTEWVCGPYRIERYEFTLPTKSVGYHVFFERVPLAQARVTGGSPCDYLADAKKCASWDKLERAARGEAV